MEFFKTPFYYDPALKLYYRLENNVLDSSPNGYDGTLVGGPSYTTGKFGNTVQFTSDSTYITVPSGAKISDLAYSTVLFWYYQSGSPTSLYHTAYSEKNAVVSGAGMFVLVNGSGGLQGKMGVFFRDTTPTSINLTGNIVMSQGVWHLVAMTVNNNVVRGYVDGVFDSGISGTRPSGTYNTNTYRMGRDAFENNQNFDSTAKMDDPVILSRALSDTEIKLIYYGAIGGSALLGVL